MTKEWNLNEKRVKCYTGDVIEGCEEWYWHYPDYCVKEFMRRLKDKIQHNSFFNNRTRIRIEVYKEIDKLAGDELVGVSGGEQE